MATARRPQYPTRRPGSDRSPGDPNTGYVLLVALILALMVGIGGAALRAYVESRAADLARVESTR